MQKHTGFTLAVLLTGSTFADYPATVMADSPLAYLRFEEEAGAIFAADSSGNDFGSTDYAALGTGEIGVNGAIGKAIRFNGDGSIVTGLTLDPSITDFSIEFLLNLNSLTDGETSVVVSNQDGIGLGRSVANVAGSGQVSSFGGGITSNSGIFVPLSDWRHCVYTYEQSTATLRFFVDGVEGTPNVLNDLDPPRAMESADGPWVIGSHKLTTIQFVDGLIDEVAIYDKRLDDPDGDGDPSDSVVGTHYEAYRDDTGIFQFQADRIYADAGEPVELSWTTSPTMTALDVDQGVGSVLAGLMPEADGRRSGSVTVNPAATTTYTLSGINPFESDSQSVEVIVGELPVIESFVTDFDEVIESQSVTLSYNITNADVVEIDNGVGMLTANPGLSTIGSETVVVNGETTFTLTATNGAGSVTAEVTVSTRPGDPSLLAHWKVGEAPDELTGTSLISETGDAFIGTFVGTPTFDTEDPAPVPGGSSASLVLDGLDSWVDILGWTGIGGASARTVAFWFKGPANQSNNNATIVSWGSNTTTNRYDTRLNGGSSGVIRTEVSGSGSNGTALFADDTWHHAAVVLIDDGSPNISEVLFYIDGQLDPLSAPGATDVDTTTTLNVRLGASRTITSRSLTGKLDDIRIYDRALDAAEVLDLVEGIPLFPEITSIVRNSDGSATIRWTGTPDAPFTVDYSKTLEEDSWLEIDDSNTSGEYTDTTFAPTENKIFYRIRLQ